MMMLRKEKIKQKKVSLKKILRCKFMKKIIFLSQLTYNPAVLFYQLF